MNVLSCLTAAKQSRLIPKLCIKLLFSFFSSQFDWDGNGTPKPSSSENLPGKKVSEQNEAIISESNSTDKLSVEPVQHRSPQIINNKRDELPDDKVTNFIPFHPDEEKETDLLTQFIQKGL